MKFLLNIFGFSGHPSVYRISDKIYLRLVFLLVFVGSVFPEECPILICIKCILRQIMNYESGGPN